MRKIQVEEFTSVDEIIIPFKERTQMKQYNKNKPHKWGIKLFAIASSSGIVHDFEVYIGKGTLTPSEHGFGISGDVVMRLSECIPKNENCKLMYIYIYNMYLEFNKNFQLFFYYYSSQWIIGLTHIIYNVN